MSKECDEHAKDALTLTRGEVNRRLLSPCGRAVPLLPLVRILSSGALSEENFLRFLVGTEIVARVSQFSADRAPANNSGARVDAFEPRLEVRKLFDVLSVSLPAVGPSDAGDIRDRIKISRQVFARFKSHVHHAVKPVHFVGVAIDRVRDFFR